MNLRPLGYEPVGVESRSPAYVPLLAVDVRLLGLERLTCSPASCPLRGVSLTNPLASAPGLEPGFEGGPTEAVVVCASLRRGRRAVPLRPCPPPLPRIFPGQAVHRSTGTSRAPYLSAPLRVARCISLVPRGAHDRQSLRQDSRDFASAFGVLTQATQRRVSSFLIRRSRRSVRSRPYVLSACALLSVRVRAGALSCAGLTVTLAVNSAVVSAR